MCSAAGNGGAQRVSGRRSSSCWTRAALGGSGVQRRTLAAGAADGPGGAAVAAQLVVALVLQLGGWVEGWRGAGCGHRG